MIRTLLLISMVPTILPAATTQIRGRVLDQNNRAPVVGANVVVVGTQEGAATTNEGYFEFVTTKSFPLNLQVTHIGFQSREITVTTDTLLIVLMEPAFLIGQDVVVLGERSQVGADVASAVEVVTAERIESLGARDVGDLLRPLPSVTIDASATGKQTISIRGSNPNEVAVFLDGLRLNDANSGLANLSAIDLNDLERVEVVKGGATALFGQGAFGGVVNLTSHKPDSNQIAFSRGYGMTDTYDQDLSIAATGRLGIIAAGGRYSGKSRRYDGSILYTNIFNSFSAALYPRFGDMVAKRYSLDNFTELPSGIVAQSDQTVLTSASYSGSILSSPEWTLFLGQRDWGWTDHFFSNLERQLKEGNLTGRIAHQIINKYMSNTLQINFEQQHFTGENIRPIDDGDTFLHERARLERTNLGYTAVVRLQTEDEAPDNPRVRLELSLRGDQFTTSHQQENWQADSSGITDAALLLFDTHEYQKSLTRRMGVRMEGSVPSMHYIFFMNHGRNQRLPTLNDLFLWKNSTDVDIRDTPLEKEFVSTTDVSFKLIYLPETPASQHIELGVTTSFFVNQYSNKITYRFYPNRPASPLNTDEVKISGYELALEGSLLNHHLRGQLAYQQLNLNDPLIFPNKPESRLTFLLALHLPWMVISYDYFRDGPQFVLYHGFVYAQKIESRESANLNLILRWRVRQLRMSLAYTIRNLFSDEPVMVDPGLHGASFPFQYHEAHRKILTFRISL